MHIVELQHKLQEARGEVPEAESKVIIRTAKADHASKLLQSGMFTDDEVSYFAQVPKSVVKAEKARIEERNRARQIFLSTGKLQLPGEMAHFTIYQR
jgi:hypothetical protein